MPEGHTLHRLARDQGGDLVGHRVAASSPQGRFADGAATLDGRTLLRADAWGKHLVHRYEGDVLLHVHLGLYGKFTPHPLPPPEPRGALRLRLVGPTRAWDLRGATACELFDDADLAALVARLGPDPIRRDADPERAWAALRRRRSPIGQALMDQSVLAGVGNVYRAEVLHAFRLHPLVPCAAVDRATFGAIWSWLVEALRRGVKERRIITVDPKELGKPRSRLTRAESTYVYRQERCLRCGAPVERFDLAGRWAYACTAEQPRPA